MNNKGKLCKKRFFLKNHTITGYGGRDKCAIKIQESGGSDVGVHCDDDCPFVNSRYLPFDLEEFDESKIYYEEFSLRLREKVKSREQRDTDDRILD